MRIYMDVCCFNRPYDDDRQDRIRMEAEAVRIILSRCETGIWKLVGSFAVDQELSKIPNPEKKEKVITFSRLISERVKSDTSVDMRVLELASKNFKTFDAIHLALSEKAEVDVFLTTDDRLLQKALRDDMHIKVPVANPLKWLTDRGEW